MNKLNNTFRIWHRYLGFFLAGIMAVYSISGIILIFRDTDFLKQEKLVKKTIEVNISANKLGEALKIKRLKVERTDEGKMYFENGWYDKTTGSAEYTVKELPLLIKKLNHFHKAQSGDPMFFMNIFFGLSLLFFAISAFWMFTPDSKIFKKGLLFSLGGVILMMLLLFI